jgi:SSS family solute:Na+ symporter
MIALFAAAMSSLDSTINSVSALTMRDIYQRFFDADPSERKEFILGKLFTVFWGVLCCGFSFYVSAIADTIIESVNKIGSALFGPILGVFVLGILVKRANQQGAIFGLAAGLLLNIYLWLFVPQVSWLWWNVLGCLVTVGVGFLLSLPFSRPDPESIKTLVFSREFNASVKYRINWKPVYWVLGVYAVLMIGIIALF